MKEEELLLFKEELARIKAYKKSLSLLGTSMLILGVVFAAIEAVVEALQGIESAAYTIILGVFAVFAIMCFAVAEFVFGKAYQDKLNELKNIIEDKKYED